MADPFTSVWGVARDYLAARCDEEAAIKWRDAATRDMELARERSAIARERLCGKLLRPGQAVVVGDTVVVRNHGDALVTYALLPEPPANG